MASSTIKKGYQINRKTFNAVTIQANSYHEFVDTSITNRAIVGVSAYGIASGHISIIRWVSDSDGLVVIFKNNGSSAYTTGELYVYYI